ncbi:MAG TPA: hypothetical protein VJ417_06640 [Candidatus Glassbacteria bacterium]|nr:hypothetical protein [Candidatus Glassbacteria bacterium]
MNEYTVESVAGGAVYRRTGAGPVGNTVLTIDPGLRAGWALLQLEGKILLAGGFLELNRAFLYASAYNMIRNLLEQTQPAAVAFEQYFIGFGAHDKSSIESRGAMKAAVEHAELSWTEINPSAVRARLGVQAQSKKLTAAGIKVESKDLQVRRLTVAAFGIPAKYKKDPLKKQEVFFPPDVFDAAAVAYSTDTIKGL